VEGADGGGAGIARAGPSTDDPLAVEGGAQALVGHVPFDDVGDRGLEHHLDGLPVVVQQLLQLGPPGGGPDPGVVLR
jgi:hypothetical protein